MAEVTQQVPTVVEQPATGTATPPAPAPSLLDQYEIEGEASSVAAEPEPAASTILPVPAPSHPRYLVQQALDLGIPQAEINEASTEQLGQVVYHTNRQLQNQIRE